MVPIHALCLQMVAKGIIALDVSDKTKVGTEDLQSSHVVITSRTGKTADGNDMLAQSIVENWKGLSCVEDLHINN